ncbi:kelch domain-containing protein 3 [Acyrthosiphon pisum]|uniref:Kelch domain-containing protein 3 n=1 Tax=Acyrthosiphon pisum TaxID=7029 RepID=A0A8R2FD83_ACYPI|nr:kelch domain-containing protein 3 [Acyrthosiphon pisum]XP_029345660.1 kelch domain-containing protein 3 [Acyrthosiphon pisum]|eukprot:XP_008188760.1 PREDICTED: kelch domain-containing protein 3 [Acyrthosiphon pisum]
MYWTVHTYGGPRRVNHAAVAIGTSIFTFGGYCSGVDYKKFKPIDIHILDTEKLKWWKLELNNQDCSCVPFQRYGHTAINLGSNIYLWGGRNDNRVCNTLYCFNTETLKWTTPSVYGNKPEPRDGHSACIIQNCMYIFGGFEERSGLFASDLYMLNLNSMVWSIIKTKGRPPSYRDFHTATAIDNKMYIFGGRSDWAAPRQTDKDKYCSDIYYLDTSRRQWIRPKVHGVKPIARRSHSAFVYNGLFYIFGGFNKNKDLHFQDINRYDPVSSTWMKILPKGTPPCARRRQICQLVNDRIFISGGTSPIFPKPVIITRLQDYDLGGPMNVPSNLKDHDDLHVLDLKPSLKDMCMVNVWENMEEMKIDNINDLHIPLSLKHDMAAFDPFEIMETEINMMQSYEENFPVLSL